MAVGVAVLFVLGSLVLLETLRSGLIAHQDAELDLRANFVVAAITHSEAAGRPLPLTSPFSGAVQPGGVGSDLYRRIAARGGESVIQIVGSNGVLFDPNSAGQSVIDPSRASFASHHVIFFDAVPAGRRAEYRIRAGPIPSQPGHVLVVGNSLVATSSALHQISGDLLLAGPILVLMAAAGGWLLAGAALRPVETLRQEADEISATDLSARLNVPATRDEISALGRTMDVLLHRLQAALRRQRNLVADAGHELRTPLAVLRAELELASKPGRSPEDLREAVRSASSEVERLSHLAEDLLLLAVAEQGELRLQEEVIDVPGLLAMFVARSAARAQQYSVSLELGSCDPVEIWADRIRLGQVLDNLLDNALRVSPADSTVTVGSKAVDGGCEISVLDSGGGFPVEFQQLAFERFCRADQARQRKGGGAGLGLAIVDTIARAHGGRAWIRNRPTDGATVGIWVPAWVGSTDGLVREPPIEPVPRRTRR